MPVSLSKRVQKVKPSPTLAMTARAAKLKAEGKDVIGLAAGEPDFDTPVHISDAGIDAIRKGITRYTAVDGTTELKDAIIAKFKRDNALSYERSEVLVSSGAKQTCFNACAALRTRRMKSGVVRSGSPRARRSALSEAFKNVMVATPGISTGYWKARNRPLAARSLG